MLPPLAKLAVRQALNYAVDRRQIFKTLYRGQGVPGTQIFVREQRATTRSSTADIPTTRTRAAAPRSVGYAKGFDLPVLSVSEADPQLAAIARYLKAINVRVQ